MKTPLNLVPRQMCRRPFRQTQPDDRRRVQRQDHREETIQLIYAHLPPAVVLATEQHLRAQTQIEQRAQQLWFARDGRSVSALSDWLQAEREVVRQLCDALRHPGNREPESVPALQ
jgi:hypothetical protein